MNHPEQPPSNSYRRRSSRHIRPLATVAPSNSIWKPTEQYPNARVVQLRLVFLHLGEIDTLNEKYHAEIYFEARWTEKSMNLSSLNLTSQQQSQLLQNVIIKLNDSNSTNNWSPQLFIENAIGQLGSLDRWITIRKADSGANPPSSPLCVNLEICEHRRMNGIFWEKLELNHFPADVQDLSISISSHHPIEKCVLIPDKKYRSFINREAFADQQEWSLYQHIVTEQRQTNEEYSFEYDDDNVVEEKKHPVVDFTCRAARRPGYYYWNGFCLIFMITLCSFCIFSIPPNFPQNRLQITCTLLLTSITFRWVVNRSLPQISYLTTLDVYGIISIFILVTLCIWHSIIAAVIFLHSNFYNDLVPMGLYATIDRYVFIGLFSSFILIQVLLFFWFTQVAYGRRREMERLDRLYVKDKEESQNKDHSRQEIHFRRSSSTISSFQAGKLPRIVKPSDSVLVITNGSTFIPIQEASNGTRRSTISMVEVQEPEEA